MARLWHSDVRAAMTLLPPEGDDLAAEEGFPSLPSPRRGSQTANQRGAGAKAFHKGQHVCRGQAVLRCRSNVMCHRFAALPDSVTGTAPLASWRRCTRGCYAPQPFLIGLRQDASLGSPSAKESKTTDQWIKPLRGIQLHAMARIPLDSVVSVPYDSNIEHAFVFAGRPKLLAAEAA